MRIFGFGSGMDIDQMVSDLMKAERAKTVDKLDKEKQISTWKQEIYQEINKDIANFIVDSKSKFELTSSTATGVSYNTSYESISWVKNASSSDTTKATATATSKALDGSYSVNIDQLAKGVTKASTGNISVADTDSNDKLTDQFTDIIADDVIQFNITTTEGSKDFTFDLSANPDLTLDDIITEVNSADLGIKMSYDEGVDRIFINSTKTGADVSLKLEDTGSKINGTTVGTNFFTQILNVSGDGVVDGSGLDTLNGQDLQFDFGEAQNMTKSSNTFSINGINITANDIGTTTINVESDVDGVYNKIKDFVNEYNSLIDKINSKLDEDIYRDYQPITEEEKKSLSDDQLKQLEDMAKSGLIKNDSILTSILSDVRTDLYETVDNIGGSFKQLTQIGIETGTYSEKGKLVIDEYELKQAIIDDAAGVMELFFKESDSTDEDTKYKESGLVTRMFDSMTEGIEQIIDKSGPGNDSSIYKEVKATILVDFIAGANLKNAGISILAQDILDINSEMYDAKYNLASIEDRYYAKFSAMETALAKLNDQSSWITSQLGGA